MILLLDIGNSRIKWATAAHGHLHFGGSVAYRNLVPEDLAHSLWADLRPPARIVAASVAGKELTEALTTWTRDRWKLEVELLTPPQQAFGVVNAYLEPRQLGADRWAALVAARHKTSAAALVVDCGTALTIDVLSAEGRHLGGLIVPGLQLMRRALVEDTAGIGAALEVNIESRADLLARDTRAGIAVGTLYAVVALIDRVASDIAGELAAPFARLITGGNAPAILPLLQGTYRFEPHLVLEGLAVMATANSETGA